VSTVLAGGPDSWLWWEWVHTHAPGCVKRFNRPCDVIGTALRQHLELTLIAVVVGLLLSVPLALLAWRWRRLESPILGLTGALYTVPSLALFALLIPVTGLTTLTAEIGLVSYTLLILVRNILVGLDGVPEEVREAARGMGYSRLRLLTRVELPLALPAIIAGIRIATVTTVGLVTVTALLGESVGGGLGRLILDGLARDFRTPLVIGAVLCLVLAVTFDALLLGLQRLLTPWARRAG
jgi:osmoprotectant transport system permease protein